MSLGRADILMITYNSPTYVRLSLPRLLETCRENDRVWLWHNGDDEETLEVVRSYSRDSRVARFHHSRENVKLRSPTNWLFSESCADLVSKVDDDCLVSHGWVERIAAAHRDNPEFGVVGSWRHPDEDFVPDVASRKIFRYSGGHYLLRNLWVQGSGFLMGRSWIERVGELRSKESFTQYCVRLAKAGAINGWCYPFVREEHMDDPRSPNTLLRTDADLRWRSPLSAQANGLQTIDSWQDQIRRSAVVLQSASLDTRQYAGWRRTVQKVRQRVTWPGRMRGPR